MRLFHIGYGSIQSTRLGTIKFVGDPERNKDETERYVEDDMQAAYAIYLEYCPAYEWLPYLGIKLLLPEGALKDRCVTELYYQLSNKNQ